MKLTSIAEVAALDFDTIIDVRSPSEFAEDHIPGAINLPVLDDEERARVGTIYKQVAPFDARKIGAALVAQNAAKHLQGPLADKEGGWRPLVYCWRGGQRSGSFATILKQVGWRVELVEGGYKAFRSLVVEAGQAAMPCPVVVLDGNTGTAKTDILKAARAQGAQVIDLEGLANHRGSLFGAMEGGQSSQKDFETRLIMEIAALDPARPVLLEAESSKIGDLQLPSGIWAAIKDAPRVRVRAPLAERAEYLARAYADITADPDRLLGVLDQLRPFQPAERVAAWQAQAQAGEYAALAGELMRDHYDPRYEKHRARHVEQERVIEAESLAPEAIEGIAAQVVREAQEMAER
ncbi:MULTISPECIES: tRNA 2-selenouridine(34) synthase MnmH [unclassified Thioclava]|uniref:tRNA 2-selenouridine(34) synthase MnmH n=1 Tax=unclassified Thioclava TaxID=2621713 RepID=UPI000B53B090|nr:MULTISPECIES: tRNA 2-selenouridine(34) synthase MnmH [unclassified Thioclava]OWY03049.1 tRNA 2-selenouridine(34) synthase MnmH [Thioclava sp. IC9]OWY09832.1 tRNA 2-selenouridine(34) synthase MnmH [Thioclava sp. F42-5]OWY14918.1 tRNA 2-selenouridine(34) synthase MnmH [Thioclava sp. JM3]